MLKPFRTTLVHGASCGPVLEMKRSWKGHGKVPFGSHAQTPRLPQTASTRCPSKAGGASASTVKDNVYHQTPSLVDSTFMASTAMEFFASKHPFHDLHASLLPAHHTLSHIRPPRYDLGRKAR